MRLEAKLAQKDVDVEAASTVEQVNLNTYTREARKCRISVSKDFLTSKTGDVSSLSCELWF